jgi:DNA-binding MarR family transcriptional regulator
VVGGLANGLSAEQLLHDLNLSDAQSERLLGALLEAHFVEAEHDSEASDTLALRNTAKGLRAARAVAEAIANVNHELSHLLTPEELLGFRKALVALTGVEMRFDESPHSSRPV